jgi:hypothetical protein
MDGGLYLEHARKQLKAGLSGRGEEHLLLTRYLCAAVRKKQKSHLTSEELLESHRMESIAFEALNTRVTDSSLEGRISRAKESPQKQVQRGLDFLRYTCDTPLQPPEQLEHMPGFMLGGEYLERGLKRDGHYIPKQSCWAYLELLGNVQTIADVGYCFRDLGLYHASLRMFEVVNDISPMHAEYALALEDARRLVL